MVAVVHCIMDQDCVLERVFYEDPVEPDQHWRADGRVYMLGAPNL